MSAGGMVAGRWWRLGARIVDLVAFGWLSAFVLVEIDQRLLGGDPLGREAGRVEITSSRSIILLLIAVLLFEVIPVSTAGATIGKAMLGLRVVRRSGQHPTWIGVDDDEVVACVWHIAKADDFYGFAGGCLFDFFSPPVGEGAHAAAFDAGDEVLPDFEGSALDEDGCHRTAPLFAFGF